MTSSHVAASTYIQQVRNINRQSPLKQIRLHVRSGLVHRCSAIGVSVCLCVCVFVNVCVCLTVHMCICLSKRSRWTMGHCCELWEFDRVIQSPLTLLPSLPDWGFQFSWEVGEKRYKEWTSAPLPLLSPCPPCSETKYAHTLMISVYLL